MTVYKLQNSRRCDTKQKDQGQKLHEQCHSLKLKGVTKDQRQNAKEMRV